MKAKLLFLLLAVILSACVTQPTPDPKVLSAEFDALVEKNHQAGLFDGSVLVAQNGQVIFSKGYGFADRENQIPNTPQTKFRIASVTKQFTAMAILLLQEQGKLNVEDDICNYITDCPENFKPVKIRHLLSQSAGLPNSTAYSMPGDQMVSKSATLFFQPGEQFKYQDVTFNIAGRIIETVSGQSYADFLKQNIFERFVGTMGRTAEECGEVFPADTTAPIWLIMAFCFAHCPCPGYIYMSGPPACQAESLFIFRPSER